MARYVIQPTLEELSAAQKREPLGRVDMAAQLLIDEIEALDGRIDQTLKDLAWLQRRAVEKRRELAARRGKL